MGDKGQYLKEKEEFLNELNLNFKSGAYLNGYYDFELAKLIHSYIYLNPIDKETLTDDKDLLEDLQEKLDNLYEYIEENKENKKEVLDNFKLFLGKEKDFIKAYNSFVSRT